MRSLIFILLITFAGTLAAQPDSPDFVLGNDELDTAYVNYLIDEAVAGKTDSVSFTLEKAIFIAEKLGFDPGVERGYNAQINYFAKEGNLSSQLLSRLRYKHFLTEKGNKQVEVNNEVAIADLYFSNQLLLKASEHYGNALSRAEKVSPGLAFPILIRLARTEKALGHYAKATTLYENALGSAVRLGEKSAQMTLHQDLAEIAHAKGNYNEEVDRYLKVFNLANELNRPKDKLVAMNNMAYAYNFLGNGNDAEATYVKVFENAPADKEPLLRAGALQNLGILYNNRNDFENAYKALAAAAKLYSGAGETKAEGTVYDFLSLVYLNNNDLHNAQEFNKLAIKKGNETRDRELLMHAYKTKSLISQAWYEFEDALAAHKRHLGLRDSLNIEERARRSKISEQQNVMSKLETELELFYVDKEINALEKARILAESDAKAERIKSLEKESELKDSEFRNKQLTANQLLAKARLEQEQQKTLLQESEIGLLNEQRKYQMERLERARQDSVLQEQKSQLLESEKRNTELELKRKAAENRNLIVLVGGLILLLGAIIFGLVKLRTKNRKIAQQNSIILEDRKIIQEEKDKSDKLLLNILPPEVAEELKEKGSTSPKAFNHVSVVFTDFSGFTQIAENLSPEDLVKTLNEIFQEFDLICERNGLSRIKTIGDAYMAAAGLPVPDPEHARKAVESALEMRDYILGFNAHLRPDEPQWNIRIGVNSGSVVAGVVGIKKFAYDIWGDTVNTASRMESSGKVGKVNVSGDTYEEVKDLFTTEYRGKVAAKNKGDIDMYFVERNFVS
ncbi:MAG: hypothetical protein H6581_21115 [Bacteroidia bacterium]|nr:hypothetical protein [Bacteroidia bacterium]